MRKFNFFIALIIFAQIFFAVCAFADPPPANASSPYFDPTPPLQQYVTADPEEQPEVVSSEPTSAPYAPGQIGPTPFLPSVPAQQGNAPPVQVPSPLPLPAPIPAQQEYSPSISGPNLPIPAATPSTQPTLPAPPTAGIPAPLPVPLPTNVPSPISTAPVIGSGNAQAQSLQDKNQPAMTGNGQPPPPIPAPELSPDEVMLAARKPLELFAGGLNQNSFLQCAKMAASVCSRAPDKTKFLI